MGMIRVSDHAEKIIKEKANGRTITATVDALLAGGGDSSIIGKLEYLENYIDKKFSRLESLIEDTAVDRVESGGPRKFSTTKTYIPWPVMQDIFYDLLTDDSPEWTSKAVASAISELNDPIDCYVQDGQICSDDYYGHKQPLLNLSPRLREFLTSKGAML